MPRSFTIRRNIRRHADVSKIIGKPEFKRNSSETGVETFREAVNPNKAMDFRKQFLEVNTPSFTVSKILALPFNNGIEHVHGETLLAQVNHPSKYDCPYCGKVFKTKYTFEKHMKMPEHTSERPFACPTCGKGFRLSSTLCRHKIIHTNQRPFKCQICDKAFNRQSTLSTHYKTHKGLAMSRSEVAKQPYDVTVWNGSSIANINQRAWFSSTNSVLFW